MKRSSEGDFGAALRASGLAILVYKPPDDARTRKPCDFMVWHKEASDEVVATWFEVKDVDTVDTFSFAELRPSQLQGIHDAARIGIPYWLAVYWRRHKSWTVSDAIALVKWRTESTYMRPDMRVPIQKPATSISRALLMSRFGIDSPAPLLSSTLKSVLLGDV